MRILVCGTTTYKDRAAIKREILRRNPTCIINGGAEGADSLALSIAKELGLDFETYEAEWTRYGRPAGPIRNQRMLDEGKPDLVLAFFDGYRSRGTNDMVTKAKAADVLVVEFGL